MSIERESQTSSKKNIEMLFSSIRFLCRMNKRIFSWKYLIKHNDKQKKSEIWTMMRLWLKEIFLYYLFHRRCWWYWRLMKIKWVEEEEEEKLQMHWWVSFLNYLTQWSSSWWFSLSIISFPFSTPSWGCSAFTVALAPSPPPVAIVSCAVVALVPLFAFYKRKHWQWEMKVEELLWHHRQNPV